MATVFYIRKGAKTDAIASSRDVSVPDLMSLYGSAPGNYKYMKGADSPNIGIGHVPAAPDSDPTHVVVKIEANEVDRDTFPEQGFYLVHVTPEP